MTELKEGDEVTITVTVQGTVWKSVDGDLMVGDGNGFEVTEENLLSHVPAPPKYKKGERFFAKQGLNDVLAVYSPSEKEPELPWLVVFSDGSYGPRDGRLLSDFRPIPSGKVELWHLKTATSNGLFYDNPKMAMELEDPALEQMARRVAEDLGLEVTE